jgi:hypothetical protein
MYRVAQLRPFRIGPPARFGAVPCEVVSMTTLLQGGGRHKDTDFRAMLEAALRGDDELSGCLLPPEQSHSIQYATI